MGMGYAKALGGAIGGGMAASNMVVKKKKAMSKQTLVDAMQQTVGAKGPVAQPTAAVPSTFNTGVVGPNRVDNQTRLRTGGAGLSPAMRAAGRGFFGI